MKFLVSICIGVAAISLALGYAWASLWPGSGLTLALGLLWLAGQRLPWRGWPDLGLVALLGAATAGAVQTLPAGWLLVGTVAALAAWDLAHFERRLRAGTPTIRDEDLLRRAHLRQLAGVTGLGLLLGWLALNLELKLGLGWAIGLGLLAIIGLGQLIRATRS
jgi:hypothetical protein